ncbi:hypothetical protein ElyMa_006650900 [Elysia marginata]|uniref:Uncharacterized protein n=1 Tax=Elysia marginata TaxID=1093978 RepID=A0AAV4INW1_9GAST|nr:hypothetical protein ElyMa_006650900 [Elysia marginata]
MERAEGFMLCWLQGRRSVPASPCPSPAVLPFPAVSPFPAVPPSQQFPPSQPSPRAPVPEESDSGDMDIDLGSALSADPGGCPLSPLVLIQETCTDSPPSLSPPRRQGVRDARVWQDLHLEACRTARDFNGYSPLWGDERLDQLGKMIEDFLISNDDILLNDKVLTFIHSASGNTSAIDNYSFANCCSRLFLVCTRRLVWKRPFPYYISIQYKCWSG